MGELSLGLSLDAETFGPRVAVHRSVVPVEALGMVLQVDATSGFSDALEVETEELLRLAWDDPPAWPWARRRHADDRTALIARIKEDGALVAQRRERGG